MYSHLPDVLVRSGQSTCVFDDEGTGNLTMCADLDAGDDERIQPGQWHRVYPAGTGWF